MNRFPLKFCISVFLIAAAAYIAENISGFSIDTDASPALARQFTVAESDIAAPPPAPNEIHLKQDTVHALQVSENTVPSTDSTTAQDLLNVWTPLDFLSINIPYSGVFLWDIPLSIIFLIFCLL